MSIIKVGRDCQPLLKQQTRFQVQVKQTDKPRKQRRKVREVGMQLININNIVDVNIALNVYYCPIFLELLLWAKYFEIVFVLHVLLLFTTKFSHFYAPHFVLSELIFSFNRFVKLSNEQLLRWYSSIISLGSMRWEDNTDLIK